MSQTREFTLSTKAVAAISFGLLPIAVFYVLLGHWMRNIPIMDDYHAIMEFVLIFKSLPSLGSKLLWIIAAQHNDYKFVFLNVFVVGQWLLLGHLNFKFYMVLGNMMQLGILWLCWRHYFEQERDLSRRIVLFLPIVFLFMQLNGVENLDWAITDMEKIPAIFFSFAALHYLLKAGRGSFVLACGCSVIAYLSSANGFMIAPIGLLLLVPKRQWVRVGTWTALLLMAVGIYLYKYVPFGVTQTGRTSFAGKPVFYLSLLGSGIENMSRFPIKGSAIVLGTILLVLFFFSIRSRTYKTQPFLFYSTLWCLLTCLLIAQGRSGFGITLSLTGRYKVFSDLLMMFGYVYLVSLIDTVRTPAKLKLTLYAAILVVATLFAASSDYFGYKFLKNRQVRVAGGINQFEADPSKNPPMVGLTDQPIPQAEPQHDRLVLNEAIRTGVYTLPPKSER